MKIGFLVRRFPVLSETFILNQIVGLISRGHQVDIFAIDGPERKTTKVHPLVEEYQLLQSTSFRPMIPRKFAARLINAVSYLKQKSPDSVLRYISLVNPVQHSFSALSLRLLYQAMTFERIDPSYDVIHCQFGDVGLKGLLFRHLGFLQGKLVVNFRGSDISKYLVRHGSSVYDSLFQEADLLIANCDFFRQKLIRLGCDPQKVIVHYSGIDCHKFSFTPRSPAAGKPVRLVTVGRLVEKKGIEYSIRAVAKLAAYHSNLEYSIIGDGALRVQLEELIQRLKMEQTIKILGWKEQEELIEILDSSHILIAPSITAENGDQDAPVNTLKEAMALGLPVVATRHGGIPELVEDEVSGCLVPERDSDAIAEKLGKLIEQSDRWPEMGRQGRKRVQEKFDIEILNNELVEVYQTMLSPDLEVSYV
ncbi:MAG: glycosyltransferase [Microcoleaceae cyanobacterium]